VLLTSRAEVKIAISLEVFWSILFYALVTLGRVELVFEVSYVELEFPMLPEVVV
jgi:hypothetical protein